MATTKVTITLDVEQVKLVRAIVAEGRATNVSAFVRHAVAIALLDAAGWSAMLSEALEGTGGPLTKRERSWADGVLNARVAKRRHRRSAA